MRTLVRLVPIAFIPFLVPPGSSADKTRYDIGDIAHDIEKAPGPEKAPAPAVELTPNSAQLDDVDLEGKRPVVEAPAAEGDDRAGGGDAKRGWAAPRVFRSLSSRLYIGQPESPERAADASGFGAGDDDDFQFVRT